VGWYRVIKTIKGHRYIYEQRTWREGKKVRTESRYIGPADGEVPRSTGERGDGRSNKAERVNTTAPIDPAVVERTFAALTAAVRKHPDSPPWGDEPNDRDLVERHEGIERCLEKLGVRLTRQPRRTYYDRLDDRVNIPAGAYFLELEEETATQTYYLTLLHEIVHWSGAPHRLARRKGQLFGDENYCREELVAEAGAVILAEQFGIAPSDRSRHADYFQFWLGRCSDPDAALTYARRHAEEARAVRFYDLGTP
jgi:hypothetical protein